MFSWHSTSNVSLMLETSRIRRFAKETRDFDSSSSRALVVFGASGSEAYCRSFGWITPSNHDEVPSPRLAVIRKTVNSQLCAEALSATCAEAKITDSAGGFR